MTEFSFLVELTLKRDPGINVVEYQGPNNWQIKIRSKHG